MIVVADTSPINYLVLIRQIDLLTQLYNRRFSVVGFGSNDAPHLKYWYGITCHSRKVFTLKFRVLSIKFNSERLSQQAPNLRVHPNVVLVPTLVKDAEGRVVFGQVFTRTASNACISKDALRRYWEERNS
jgi:hypothetical protein